MVLRVYMCSAMEIRGFKMKKIIMSLVLMALAGDVWAQTLTQSQSELSAFISSSIQSAEGDSAFNLNGQKTGAFFVPLRVLDKPFPNILDVGLGAEVGGGVQGLVSARINIPQVANGIFGTKWFTTSTHGPILPTLFAGPAVKAAWPIKTWTWKNDLLFLIGIPFGSI